MLALIQTLLLIDDVEAALKAAFEDQDNQDDRNEQEIDMKKEQTAFSREVLVTLAAAFCRPSPGNAMELLAYGMAGFNAIAAKIGMTSKGNVHNVVYTFSSICKFASEEESFAEDGYRSARPQAEKIIFYPCCLMALFSCINYTKT